MTRAFKGAFNLFRVRAQVEPNESLLIVTDSETDSAIASTIMAASARLGVEAVTVTMSAKALTGNEPSAPVVAPMLSLDVIICPTNETLFHTNARTAACRRGARFISMAGATMQVLASDAMLADFAKGKVLRRLVQMLPRAKRIRVTSAAGTDLTLCVLGRRGRRITGMRRRRGDATGVPDIEAYIAPLEHSTKGKLVIDGSTCVTGLVRQPIKIDVKQGIARTITGGSEARRLLRTLRKAGGSVASSIAEFGIGLNPLARIRGAITEDEAVLGTAHWALGDNQRFGGRNSAPTHVDMVLRRPRIQTGMFMR
jgi:leucyl aminopeptidase (aminopeptidase T)